MNKILIGCIFIAVGLAYGSFVIDSVYNHTLGWLVEHGWVKPPTQSERGELAKVLGRKATIILYSLALIIIGIFIIWNRNS